MKKRERVTHPTGGEKLTQQHFADQTNINKIVEKHLRTGEPLRGPGIPSGRQPRFMSLTGKSYHEMLCQVQDIQGEFAALPGRIRKRFSNNPYQLVKFVEDPENLAEAIALGIVAKGDLDPQQKEQMDLADEAEKIDRQEYEAWKRKKRANPEPELEHDDPEEGRPAKSAGRRRTS